MNKNLFVDMEKNRKEVERIVSKIIDATANEQSSTSISALALVLAASIATIAKSRAGADEIADGVVPIMKQMIDDILNAKDGATSPAGSGRLQ